MCVRWCQVQRAFARPDTSGLGDERPAWAGRRLTHRGVVMPFHPDRRSRARQPPSPREVATGPLARDPDSDQLLYTPAEAAALLRIRESWLRRRAAARLVPCTFLGRHLRFSPTDLAAIITEHARPAGTRRPRRPAHRPTPSTSEPGTHDPTSGPDRRADPTTQNDQRHREGNDDS